MQIRLSGQPASLINATKIHLACKRPRETDYNISRDLVIPDDVLDENLGIVSWMTRNGELAVRGRYRIMITVTFADSSQSVVSGLMNVS